MFKIIKNTWLIFKKTPGYIMSMTVFPIMMLLLMSIVLAYSNAHNITVIDQSSDGSGRIVYKSLEQVEGIKIIESSESEITEKLMTGNIEMAVIIKDGGKTDMIMLSGGSEVEPIVRAVIEASHSQTREESVDITINPVKSKGITLSNSLGIMLFKFITASSMLAGLLIRERNNRMRGRIFLSGISPFSYVSGKAIVYLGSMCLTALIYYVFALIFNFDFGMSNPLYFFMMIVITNIFSIGVYTFLSTMLKDEGMLWSVGTFIFFPMAILSGALFPYNTMPEWMQSAGRIMPQRWISNSIELIQKKNSVVPALPFIGLILSIALGLFLLAVLRVSKTRKSLA